MNFNINTDRLIQTFISMVSINSESGNEEEFGAYMRSLGASLGFTTKKDKYGNIYLYSKGRGEGIMLSTHLDTVSPGKGIKPKLFGKYITSGGDTILGADSKAGIAAMIETVRLLKEKNITHRPFVITLTRNEESGIPTADKIISDIRLCIVPDRGTPVGEIITEAPYAQVYEVKIKGKAVYAPTNYSEGKHAIMAANFMIISLPWGDIDKYTTTNIGIIKGGLMTSMVPEDCSFKGNCYSFNKNSFDSFLKQLVMVVKKADMKFGTKSKVNMLEYFGGYKINRSDHLVKLVENAMKKSNIVPVYKVYKAVTNANHLNQIGIKSVLISTGVENQHTINERISVESLKKMTKILTNLLTS